MVKTEKKREEVRQQIVTTPHILVRKLTQYVPTFSCTSVYCTLKDLRRPL